MIDGKAAAGDRAEPDIVITLSVPSELASEKLGNQDLQLLDQPIDGLRFRDEARHVVAFGDPHLGVLIPERAHLNGFCHLLLPWRTGLQYRSISYQRRRGRPVDPRSDRYDSIPSAAR